MLIARGRGAESEREEVRESEREMWVMEKERARETGKRVEDRELRRRDY